MDAVAVDVTHWELARQRSRLAALSALLSPEENARVARFAIPMLRERYALAHGILRETLAAMTGEAPAALRFERGPDGKPALVDGGDVAFNLSKSGEGLLIATARGAGVGCDLEQLRPNSEARSIGSRRAGSAQANARRWRGLAGKISTARSRRSGYGRRHCSRPSAQDCRDRSASTPAILRRAIPRAP